jgi:hypothetical protein
MALSTSLAWVSISGDLGELEARAGVREHGHDILENFGLRLVFVTETVDELKGEVAVIDRMADSGQIVREALEFAGVGGDGEVPVQGVAEGLAKVEVPRGFVVEEEPRETSPSGARPIIDAGDEAVEVVAERGHEPWRDVDIHNKPKVIRVWWSHAVGNVVEGLVHGEEERDDLPPLGVVLADRGDLELDVVGDVDDDNWVGRREWREL